MMYVRDCGPSVPTWQPRWKIWPPISTRIHHFATPTSMAQCSLTPSIFWRDCWCVQCTEAVQQAGQWRRALHVCWLCKQSCWQHFQDAQLENVPDLEVKRHEVDSQLHCYTSRAQDSNCPHWGQWWWCPCMGLGPWSECHPWWQQWQKHGGTHCRCGWRWSDWCQCGRQK